MNNANRGRPDGPLRVSITYGVQSPKSSEFLLIRDVGQPDRFSGDIVAEFKGQGQAQADAHYVASLINDAADAKDRRVELWATARPLSSEERAEKCRAENARVTVPTNLPKPDPDRQHAAEAAFEKGEVWQRGVQASKPPPEWAKLMKRDLDALLEDKETSPTAKRLLAYISASLRENANMP